MMTTSAIANPHFGYLVESAWLQKNLDTADVRVFDCTVNVLPNPDPKLRSKIPFVFESGRSHYDQAHIPKAGFIDLPGELSDPLSELPLMSPPEERFVDVISRCGIGNDDRVVLYSSTEPNWAARIWWMLRSFGFDNAVILNGGWAKWIAEGRPVSKQACTYGPKRFIARHRANAFVDKYDVMAAINNDSVRIINALPFPIYSGSSDIAFGRKGRIEGSVNVPFGSLHHSDSGTYLPSEVLHKNFDVAELHNAERVITYCGGGIASSNTAFALTMLGYENVAVYDGSMLEWGNDSTLPMETD